MSPIGRIFIVINLVLAVAFLGWASAALSKSANFKAELDEAKAAHVVALAAVKADYDSAIQQKDTAEKGKQAADLEVNNLQGQNLTLAATNDAQKTSITNMEARLEGMGTDLKEFDDRNEDLAKLVASKSSELETANDEINTLTRDRDDLQTDKDGLERDLVNANNMIAALERDVQQKVAEISKKDTLIATAQEVFGADFATLLAMPHINAAVQLVSNEVEPGLVSLSVGKAHGVQRGFTFEIFNGGQYKGRVRVINVQEDQCSAVVEKLYEGRAIAQGDSAATHI